MYYFNSLSIFVNAEYFWNVYLHMKGMKVLLLLKEYVDVLQQVY